MESKPADAAPAPATENNAAAAAAPKKEAKPQNDKKQQKQPQAKPAKKDEAKAVEIVEKNPEYIQHRIKIWDELKKQQDAELAKHEAKEITITLPDGKEIKGQAFKTSPLDIARGISKKLAENVIVAKLDGDRLWDVWRPLEESCKLQLLDFNTAEGKKTFWHSSAHLLGQALERMFGGYLCVGPPLADGGFYYDCAMERAVSTEDFAALDGLVRKIIADKQPFERLVLSKAAALDMFRYSKYKCELISGKVPEGGTCSVYRVGPLIDLCKGPHVPDTSRIKAFSVWKNSSAYWQGKADQDALQRVYGMAHPDAKAHAEWAEFQAEAARRDHRVLGRAQELFFFHPYSPGSAFFLPHGTRLYNTLMNFMRAEYRRRGFTEVLSPNVFNNELWITSGHWQNYAQNMFAFEIEKQTFALKPMNCPGHCLMFGHAARSYKELPLRLADFGVLHRNELSGALTGLTRVRKFQQDDAHIFCREDQVAAEIKGALDFLQHVYGIFGFTFTLELSTRPENSMGTPEQWQRAEAALADALNAFGRPWKINAGDGAFYGPKIDIQVQDALKRAHQCATIQLDFQLPQKFKLEYMAADGKPAVPVIVHRAILGSVERMMAILIEHTAGKWPLWLSPRQVVVVPVSEPYFEYARAVHDELVRAGFFADVDLSDETMNKKVYHGQHAQYNFILVVGEKEQTDRSVCIRTRDDNKVQGTKPIAAFIEDLRAAVAQFK